MAILKTLGKLAVVGAVIAGVVVAGGVDFDGTLPGDGGAGTQSPTTTPAAVTDEPVVGGGAATPTPSPSPTAVPATDGQIDTTLDRDGLETSVHGEINGYLQGIGEDALTWEPLLRDPAQRHAEAMARARTVGRDVGGATAAERVSEDYTCDPGITLARVDAGTGGAAESIVDEWVQTERTEATIANNLNRRTSTGAAQGPDGDVYVVTVFC